MLNPVYRTATFLCQLVACLPIGTNLGMAHLLWTLLAGYLLPSRGAVFPALHNSGANDKEARQAEAALREGKWDIQRLLRRFHWLVHQEHHAQRVSMAGWRPLLIDWVGFFRPRLARCSSKHYDSSAGKSLPAIELGMVATVRQIQARTIPVLVELNRSGDTLSLLQLARTKQSTRDVLVADRQVKISHLEAAGICHFVVRSQQNLSARRSDVILPEPGKRGRKPTRGRIVRPLARHYKGKILAATPADREENFVENGRQMEAKWFDKIVIAGSNLVVSCLVIKDPRYKNEWVLLTDLSRASAATVYQLYCSRCRFFAAKKPCEDRATTSDGQANVRGTSLLCSCGDKSLPLAGDMLAVRFANFISFGDLRSDSDRILGSSPREDPRSLPSGFVAGKIPPIS